MDFEIARRTVDYLIKERRLFAEPSVNWDFIGGEPFLEIELIDRLSDYIKTRLFETDHPWFNSYRFVFSTNGLLYADPRVQRYVKKNRTHLSIGISLDGTKRKHDLQRVFPDGRGSYAEVIKVIPLWLKQFPNASTKSTIGHDDLPYIKESVLHLWSLGIKQVNMNCVFEDVWRDGDDAILEEQLRSLADHALKHGLYRDHHSILFQESLGRFLDPELDNQNWCGAGKMLAVDGRGDFYPCIRFTSFSLQNRKARVIGNCFSGVDTNKLRPYLALDRRSQSPPECISCEVNGGCPWCQGVNYDFAETNTIYQRATFLCKMHKARVRANQYYLDRLNKINGVAAARPAAPLPLSAKNVAVKTQTDLHSLILLLDRYAVPFCNYAAPNNGAEPAWMPLETLERALAFAQEKRLALLCAQGVAPLPAAHCAALKRVAHRKIVPFALPAQRSKAIPVIQAGDVARLARRKWRVESAILRVPRQDMPQLAKTFTLLKGRLKRLNVRLLDLETYTESDFQVYQEQCAEIARTIAAMKWPNKGTECNLLTDRPVLAARHNCEAGINHVTVAPNGLFYLCPGFYYQNEAEAIGSLKDGIQIKNPHLLTLDAAPICRTCDANHCLRCLWLNKRMTDEINTPSRQQCIAAHLEREASLRMCESLGSQRGGNLGQLNPMPPLDYLDPFEKLTHKTTSTPSPQKKAVRMPTLTENVLPKGFSQPTQQSVC
jgi:radical SAM peptide maturase (CXXX-repeat target family)/CXXX repeat peptide maturase